MLQITDRRFNWERLTVIVITILFWSAVIAGVVHHIHRIPT